MKESYIVNAEGFLVDVVLEAPVLEEDQTLVTEPWAEGTYKPRWNGEAWEEGLTAEEISALTPIPVPTDSERISALEDAMTMILGL